MTIGNGLPGFAGLLLLAVLMLGGTLFISHTAFASRGDTVAILKVDGMTCGGCAVNIERALKALSGVESVKVDLGGGRAVVDYDTDKIKAQALAEAVTAAGYKSSILQVVSAAEYARSIVPGATAGQDAKKGCACCNKQQ